MNKKWKGAKKPVKSSPVLFEDEDMGTSSDEVKPKSCATPHSKRLTDHSTPIGNKVAFDSPELNYNESPIIEPLTQHPPSEVGWDYRQVQKDDEDGNPQILMDTCTPKRSTNHLLSKKRNSNSPLLYKPVKKKLIQEPEKDREQFMNLLKQINSTAKQKKDNDEVSKKADSSSESQAVVDMELASDDSDLKLQVSANTNESPGQGKNEVAQAKSENASLDDSMDQMMVLCSQEVEAMEFGTKESKKIPALHTIQENPEASCNKISEAVFKNPAKENIQPSVDKAMNVSDVSSRNSSKSGKSESFPDDSFDDFFVNIDDKDLCKDKEIQLSDTVKTVKTYKPSSLKIEDTVFKSSEQQKKFFQSKGSAQVEAKKAPVTNSNYAKSTQNTKVFIQNKVVNEKASFGYLNKDYAKTSNSSAFNSGIQNNTSANGTRLFKAKSFSDSNFFQQNHQNQNLDRSRSNLNINSTNYQKQQNSEGYGSSSSSENKGWRRTNSSSSIGSTQFPSVTRLTNSEGSQSTSTPAEIERKRQEAIARRQKKMSNNVAQRRPLQQPVKR